jgi:hypothetical protein
MKEVRTVATCLWANIPVPKSPIAMKLERKGDEVGEVGRKCGEGAGEWMLDTKMYAYVIQANESKEMNNLRP